MTYIKIILLFILVLLDRCGIIQHRPDLSAISIETVKRQQVSLNGTWRLSHKMNSDTSQSEEVQDPLLLSFFPDSTFTEVKVSGGYKTGKWRYSVEENTLHVFYPDQEKTYLTFMDHETSGLKVLALQEPSGQKLSLSGFGKTMETFTDDPFNAINNTWRIKPSRAEDDSEIRARLLSYIAHVNHLLRAAEKRRQQLISWEFSKGIIKIYNGGIGLVAEEKIPDIWMASFYSKEDAMKAYKMFDHYLRTTSYKGKNSGDWVKDDYTILTSIYNGLRADKGV